MNYQFPHTMKSTYPDTKAKMRLKSSLEFGSLAKKKKDTVLDWLSVH